MNIFLVMTSLNPLKMSNQKFHNVEYYDGKWKQKKCPFVFIFHHRFNMMKLLIVLFIMKLFAEIKILFFSLFTFLGLRKVDYPNDIIFANIRQSVSARSFCQWNLALIFWRWKNWSWSKLIALKSFNISYLKNPQYTKAYSEPCQTSR